MYKRQPRVRPAHTTLAVRDHGAAGGGALQVHPLFAKLTHAATAAPTMWMRQSEGWHSCAARRRRYSPPLPDVSDGPASLGSGEHSPPRGVVAISRASVAPCGGPTPADIVAMQSRSLMPRDEKLAHARAMPARVERGRRGRARDALPLPSRDEQPPRRLVAGCPADSGQCADRGGKRADDEKRAPLLLRGAGEERADRYRMQTLSLIHI